MMLIVVDTSLLRKRFYSMYETLVWTETQSVSCMPPCMLDIQIYCPILDVFQ